MEKIFINGLGWTGSSAIVDALRRYTDVNFIPNEFDDLRVPYGIYDLYQQKLARLKNNHSPSFSALAELDFKSGIPKYRAKGLIDALPSIIRAFRLNIPKTTPNHVDRHYRLYFLKNFFRVWSESKIFNKFKSQLETAVSDAETHDALVEWINNIVNLYTENLDKPIIIDQGLLIENADSILDIITDSKLVLVIRNPIKQLADILDKNVFFLRGMSWRTRYLFGVDRHDLKRILQQFADVTAYRLELFSMLYKKLGNNKIIIVDYDNFLSQFNYEFGRICNFINVHRISNKVGIERFDLSKSQDRNNILSLDFDKYENIIKTIDLQYQKIKKLSND